MAVKEPSESAFRGGERRLLEQLGEIEARLARLEEDVSPWTVYINSFAPEPYDLRRPIPVLLRQVGDEVRKLSATDQDAIASLILEEIQDEQLWDETFARSQGKLARMAAKARDDIRAGKVRNLEIDEL